MLYTQVLKLQMLHKAVLTFFSHPMCQPAASPFSPAPNPANLPSFPCQPGLHKKLAVIYCALSTQYYISVCAAVQPRYKLQHSGPDHWDLAVEYPGELGLHDRLALHDTLLALCQALELNEQALNVLLSLLGLRGQPCQLCNLPVLHQELHDVHIVLHSQSQALN